MRFEILILFFFLIFILLINFLQIKFNFCLDNITDKENHKKLLSLNKRTPVSGTIYFSIILSVLFYKIEPLFTITCLYSFFNRFLCRFKNTKISKIKIIISIFNIITFSKFKSKYYDRF